MPRRLRVASGGYAYQVLNRGVGKMHLFAKERDIEAFEEIIGQAKDPNTAPIPQTCEGVTLANAIDRPLRLGLKMATIGPVRTAPLGLFGFDATC